MTHRRFSLAFGWSAIVVIACCRPKDSTAVWNDILSKCAAGAQVRNVLFFSLSNNIGPGSIWKKSPESGYIAVRTFDTTAPRADKVINRGVASSCNGATAASSSFAGDVGVQKLFAVMPVGVSGELKNARQVQVGIDSWAWDEIVAGPFSDMLTAMADQDPKSAYARDLQSTGLVVGRAVRANGIVADLAFQKANAAALQAKYPTGIPLEGKAQATWTDSTTLRLKIPQPIYIAVQMYKWTPEGLSAGQLKPIELEDSARAETVEPDTISKN